MDESKAQQSARESLQPVDMSWLSTQFKDVRQQAGLSQSYIAKHIGVHHTSIYGLENNKHSISIQKFSLYLQLLPSKKLRRDILEIMNIEI